MNRRIAPLDRPRFHYPKAGRTRKRDRVRTPVTISVVTYVLLSSSYGQESVRQGADAVLGEQLFNNACRTCHTTREGDNRLGPHLHKIIGRKAGSLPDYGYSEAMKRADFVWTEETLERFIANPDQLVPGNNMKPFGGLASAGDRTRIVSFLRSVTSGQ